MKKRYRNLSDNTLSELADLMFELQRDIRRYSHVSENLPDNFIQSINAIQDDILNERTRREND